VTAAARALPEAVDAAIIVLAEAEYDRADCDEMACFVSHSRQCDEAHAALRAAILAYGDQRAAAEREAAEARGLALGLAGAVEEAQAAEAGKGADDAD